MAILSNSDRRIINDTNLFPQVYSYHPVIASGQANSDGIAVRGASIIGIAFPASMTGASLTVQFSMDNGVTWSDINGLTLSVATGDGYNIDPAISGWPIIRFVSASNEAAARTLTVIVKYV